MRKIQALSSLIPEQGLEALAVARLWEGLAGPSRDKAAYTGWETLAGYWGTSYLSTTAKINCCESALGAGADRLFPPSSWQSVHICVKGILLKKGK